MECNSCAGERQGGLAETPLPDPRTAQLPPPSTTHTHTHTHPPPPSDVPGSWKAAQLKSELDTVRDSAGLLHIQNRVRGREEREGESEGEREREGESGTGSAEKESTKRRKVEQGRGTGGWVKGEGKTKEGEGRHSRVIGGDWANGYGGDGGGSQESHQEQTVWVPGPWSGEWRCPSFSWRELGSGMHLCVCVVCMSVWVYVCVCMSRRSSSSSSSSGLCVWDSWVKLGHVKVISSPRSPRPPTLHPSLLGDGWAENKKWSSVDGWSRGVKKDGEQRVIVEIRAKQQQKQKAAQLSFPPPWLTEEHTASSLGVTDRGKKKKKRKGNDESTHNNTAREHEQPPPPFVSSSRQRAARLGGRIWTCKVTRQTDVVSADGAEGGRRPILEIMQNNQAHSCGASMKRSSQVLLMVRG